MLQYIVKRPLFTVLVPFAVSIAVFSAVQPAPGGGSRIALAACFAACFALPISSIAAMGRDDPPPNGRIGLAVRGFNLFGNASRSRRR